MEHYAYLMVDFETPDFIKDLQANIPENEIYRKEDIGDGFTYGLETETHTTIVPCLDNDADLNKIKGLLLPLNKYVVMIENISVFECDEFDVLKCDVRCDALFDSNFLIKDVFDTHTEYNEYHPHVTIAYMKKGCADKYMRYFMKEPIFLKPICFSFGYYDNGNYTKITFTE